MTAARPAPLVVAWSFLTSLPAPAVPYSTRALGAAIAWFPLVGACLGALLGAAGLVLDRILPPDLTAVALLALGALLTGGLHLDGLMDTADGVFGGTTRERRLEIMRDSRVGSFGVIAGILALLGQYAALTHLLGLTRLLALVVALGLSRWVMALAIVLFPSARPEGLGAAFRAAAGLPSLAIATVLAVVLAAAAASLGFRLLGPVALILAALTAVLGGQFFRRRLGGLTGDVYGALAVLAETLVLIAAAAPH